MEAKKHGGKLVDQICDDIDQALADNHLAMSGLAFVVHEIARPMLPADRDTFIDDLSKDPAKALADRGAEGLLYD